ncbi:MAG: hypothetical protein WC306_03855, partial [Candidatus Paceibacterota bacterium]
INNTGDLSLVDPAAWGYAIHALNGAVNISTASPLTVNANVIAGGDITLSAGENASSTTDTLTMNADIVSIAGNIILRAGDDITQNTGTTIQTQTAGKTISLYAGYNDLDSYGNINQVGNPQILTNDGDINLTAWGDIRLGYINAGTGTATLVSENRRIVDNNADAINIVASKLILDSALGIGSHPLWGEDALETQVSQLAARVTSASVNSYNININNQGNLTLIDPGAWGYAIKNSGATGIDTWGNDTAADININNDGSLQITADVVTNGGDITISATSSITQNDGTQIITNNGNALVNAGGDLSLASVNAGTGTATITSGGAITDNGDTHSDVIATSLVLSAANGIGSGNALETQVSNLQATNSTSGNIEIDNTGNLNILGVANDAVNEDVLIKVHSNLIIGANGFITTKGGDITLEADGDIYVHKISTDGTFSGSNIPTTGTVTITAGGNIEDGYDVNGNPDDVYDISADNIILTGANIGTTSLAPIEIRSNGLTINSNGIVSLFHKGLLHLAAFTGVSFNFINAGDLYVDGNIITNGGDINLSVVDDPNLIINALLDSHGGNVNLSAADHILLNNFAAILTRGGNFSAAADSDNNYFGTFIMDPGSSIDTASGAVTPGTVFITGDDAEIYGNVYAGNADITITPNMDQTIGLGGGVGAFVLSDDELDRLMTTGLLTVGSATAGDISVDFISQGSKTLKLISSGNLTEWGTDAWGADITVDHLILDIAGNVGTADNGIETEIVLLEGRAGGLININEFDNLALNTLQAKNVILTLVDPYDTGASLTDNNGAAPNIIADTAILDVTKSIDLDTELGTLNARVRENTATGDIHIDNTGALVLDDLAGWGYAVRNYGRGNIDIATSSPMTVNADVIARRAITLTANGASNGDIIINANIQSIGNNQKNINLNAARDIIHNLGTVSTTATINETAGRNIEMYNDSEVLGGIVNVIARNLRMFDTSNISGNNIVIDLSNNLRMHNHSSIIGGNIDIDADNNMIMQNHSKISATGSVNIDANYVGMLANSLIESNDYVDIDTGNLEMSGNSIIQADNYVDINSFDDVNMRDSSAINSNGNVIIATGDDVLMYDSSSINAGNDVDIDAGGEVLVSNSSIYAGNDVFIDAVENITLGVIEALNSIHLNTTAGNIVDNNGNDINLTTPNLYMYAYGNIGVGGDRIDTDVSDIWDAIASHGNVLINELDGVNLWNIQALGSIVDIITGGDTYAYYVYAQGNGTLDDAIINLLVTSGNLFIQNSSTVYAHQLSDGKAEINLIALNGDINVLGGSTVKAVVDGDGTASVNMIAGVLNSSGMIIDSWWDSEWDAGHPGPEMFSHNYHYDNTFTGVGTINISDNSSVLAQAGSGSATVDMMAANINVHSSLVKAGVIGNGSANVNMLAGNLTETKYIYESYEYYPGDPANPYYYYSEDMWNVYSGLGSINIDNNSSVLANIGSGSSTAGINIVGFNIVLSSSIVKANVETHGNAYVNLYGGDSINLIPDYNHFRSKGNVSIIDGSQVLATIGASSGSNVAQVNILSGGTVVDASTVAADLIGQGSAYIYFLSAVWPYEHGDITVRNNSIVRASVSSGTAGITFYGDSVDILSSTIQALATDLTAVGSNAFVRIYGNGSWGGAVGNISILDSIINAAIAGSGTAEILIRSLGDGTDSLPGDLLIDNSDIVASVAGDGSALVNLVTEQYGYWSGAYLHNNITIRNASLIQSSV